MSDDEDEDEGGPKRRAPLSRSRRLSSRRRRAAGGDDEDGGDEAGGGEESATASSPAASEEPPTTPESEEPDITRPVQLPPALSSGEPDFPLGAPPPAERLASVSGSARRLAGQLSQALSGLSRTAQEQTQTFGREVVRPLSSALLEAAVSLLLLFAMGAGGLSLGRLLKLRLAGSEPAAVGALGAPVTTTQASLDPSAFAPQAPTAEQQEQARKALESYLTALQKQQFPEAYEHLSPEWRQELSYEAFAQGYSKTLVTGYLIADVESPSPGQVRLQAELEVDEGGQRKLLAASYLAIATPQGWRLDASTFRE